MHFFWCNRKKSVPLHKLCTKTMFLTLLFGLVMTWTVETKSSVSSSGDVPNAVAATYANTYQKGDVRKGDTAVFVMSGTAGLTMQKVEIYLKSNSTSGAGVLTVYADLQQIAQKSGDFKTWFSSYDNTNYHALTLWQGTRKADSWAVQVVGTANSLHIEKFVFTYQPAPAYSVTLMNGKESFATLTETEGGAGVSLPAISDNAQWTFIGWSPCEWWHTSELPLFYPAGSFYPMEPTTLWALWQRKSTTEENYVTDLQSGDYIYCETTQRYAMTGVPQNGKMGTTIVQTTDSNQVYTIVFDESLETATLQHKASGTFIGYTSTSTPQLTAAQSTWHVWHGGARTALFMTRNNKTYMLWPATMIGESLNFCTSLLEVSNISETTTALLKPAEEEMPYFTCHPESPEAIERVNAPQQEIIVPFGNYEIHIRDGKKELRLRN